MSEPIPEENAATSGRLEELYKRFYWNVRRAQKIQGFADERRIRDDPRDARPFSLADEILRSAIVFGHAALDDYLRGLGRLLYPLRGPLERVPLAGFASEKVSRRSRPTPW